MQYYWLNGRWFLQIVDIIGIVGIYIQYNPLFPLLVLFYFLGIYIFFSKNYSFSFNGFFVFVYSISISNVLRLFLKY